MRSIASIAGAAAVLVGFALFLAPAASAATCGGAVVCQCGDTVTSNYTMTADLGPCPRLPTGDTIGLRLTPGVTLDCQNFTISGPGDMLKDAFGVRIGNGSSPDSSMTIRNCQVTKFWWGVYVQNAGDVLIENNRLFENGWKDPTQNGTGYGLDVANSQDVIVQGNWIENNGNEGFHLSASELVTVDGNHFRDNGREQLYMIHSDHNFVTNNRTEGGTQGLEMRWSSHNVFTYNEWTQSPLQMLENDNVANIFFYDSFEGRLFVGAGSTDTLIQLSSFANPTGTCLSVNSTVTGTEVYKGHFGPCTTDVSTSASVLLNRSVNNLATVAKSAVLRFPGCTADIDLDANVTGADGQIILAAMDSVIGADNWEPEADLDHDGDVDAADFAIYEAQLGPCGANLVVSAVSEPPHFVIPGTMVTIADTVQNQSRFAAGVSRTQYYLSVDTAKDAADRLLGGRAVPAIAGNGMSSGTINVTIPTTTLPGTYFLLACADDLGVVEESNESDNCRVAAGTVQVGRPDLVVTALTNPPPAVALGSGFTVTETVRNQSPSFGAGASRVQYYLSSDAVKNTGDRLLVGSRSVPVLAPGAGSPSGVVPVTVPTSAIPGTYFVLACADDTAIVIETDETNNCLASGTKVQVGKPDVAVTAVTDPPTALVPGNTFSVTDTTRNVSLFQALASRTQYYLSLDPVRNSGDKLLTGFRSVPALAPGAESGGVAITVTVPSGTPVGTYFLLACADDAGAMAEADETNNCKASTGQIKLGRPDLVTAAVSDPPGSIPRGHSFQVTDTARNLTEFPAGPATIRVQYYLSLDTVKNAGDKILTGFRTITALAPNTDSTMTTTVTIPSGTPLGIYYLLACVDDTNAVIESNEANNCTASTNTVNVGP